MCFLLNPSDIKSSIGDSEDELGRMLAVLRFWFTKDLVSSVPFDFEGAASCQWSDGEITEIR